MTEAEFVKFLTASGLDDERILEIAYSLWLRTKAASDLLHISGETTVKGDEPIVTLTWGPLEASIRPVEARALAHMLYAAADAGETISVLRKYFAEAKDQQLSQKILASLLPRLRAAKQSLMTTVPDTTEEDDLPP